MFWKEGGGPSRSGHCDTADTPAPPPLPIEVINITDTDTRIFITVGSTREVRVFVRLVCRVTCDLHICLNETCYILCIHVIAVAIFTYLHPIFNPFSPHTHSFKWEKPELQYTANISDYQVHLALEPLEPNEMPDQIGSQVILIFPYSVSNFTLLNVFPDC